MQIKAQRGRRLHAVQIQDLAARKSRDVAALAELAHQLGQHRMPRAMRGVVEQHVLRQPHQPLARAVVATVAISLQDSGALQLRKHAVHGRLGQPRLFHHGLQGEGLALLRHGFQQREQTQIGRVSVQASRGGVFAVLHIAVDHSNFHFSSQFVPQKEIYLHKLEKMP